MKHFPVKLCKILKSVRKTFERQEIDENLPTRVSQRNGAIDSRCSESVAMSGEIGAHLDTVYHKACVCSNCPAVACTIAQTFQFITTELTPNISEINRGTGINTQMEIVYKSNKEVRFTEKYLELHLLMIDEDYYKFELAKKNNSSGFPNYEYTKLYSNVKNGFGIVASYNNYVLKPLNVN